MYIRNPLRRVLGELGDQIKPEMKEVIEDLFDENYKTEPLSPSYQEQILSISAENARYYIFCLSEGRDLLNMWNYYVKNGNYQGYNLCFTNYQLVKCLEQISLSNMRVFYGQVLYTYKEQADALQRMLLERNNEYLHLVSLTRDKESSLEMVRGQVTDYINDYKLFYKDDSFSGEKEYRFVIKLPNNYVIQEDKGLKMGFAIKNGIFTPCCDLKLNPTETINSITIAPIMEKELAEKGLRRFLKMNNYNPKISIEASSIPIRY
jgi:hypothetical protein